MPSFAAIIPNYNDGAHIAPSLESLERQTRPFDEILIIDDGSTDDSVALIGRLIAGKPRIRLLARPENRGIVSTLNEGLGLVTADFVHMASANDTYHLRMVEFCARAAEEQPDLALLCGNAMFTYKKTGRQRPVFMHLPQAAGFVTPETFREKVRQSPLTFFGGGIVMRREAVLKEGGLQASLRWHTDWAMYYLLAFRHGLYFVPEPIVNIEVADESYSSQAMIWNKQRDVIHQLIAFLGTQDEAMKARWKYTALLPTYNLRALEVLRLPECRWYVTPLLLWRLLVHSVAYRLKYYLPRSLLIKMREYFRV